MELRAAFLDAVRPDQAFQLLFDHLPGVLFFAKDREGRLLAANQALLDLYGFPEEESFWGSRILNYYQEVWLRNFARMI